MRRVELAGTNGWASTVAAKPAAAVRLFCFPYAGLGAGVYRQWAGTAPDGLEVATIQLPGRENRIRERPFDSLTLLTKALAAGIAPALDRPFAFFGHSLGAIIAFEAARELRRLGVRGPKALAVSACRAPQIKWPFPPIRHFDDLALLREMQARYGAVPQEVIDNEELRPLITPGLRADMSVIETYVHDAEPPFACPIAVFGGTDDPTVDRADLEAWREQTSGPFSLTMFPGDHFFAERDHASLLSAIAKTLGM